MTSYIKIEMYEEENKNNFKVQDQYWFISFYKSYFTKNSDWDTNTWFNMIYYNLYYDQKLFGNAYYLDKFACELLEKFKIYKKHHSQKLYDIIGKKLYIRDVIKYIPKEYYNYDMFDIRTKNFNIYYEYVNYIFEDEVNNIPPEFITEDYFIYLYNRYIMDIEHCYKGVSNSNVDIIIKNLGGRKGTATNNIHKTMIKKDLYNLKRIESMIKIDVNFIIDISNKYENKYDLSRMWLYCISKNKEFIFKCPKQILENYSIPSVYQ